MLTKSNCLACLLPVLFIWGCASQENLPDKSADFAASPIFLLDRHTDAVIKDFDAHLKIKAIDAATYSVHKVVTIQRRDAREHGRLVLTYGEFQDILDVDGALYAKDGTLIRHLSKEDGRDISLSDGYSIYQDTRLKTYQLYHNDYPYTIVYNYTLKLKGLLNLPMFMPQGRRQFVQRAQLKVEAPADLSVLHYSINVKDKPQKSRVGPDSLFAWNFENLATLTNEPFDPVFAEKAPRVLLAAKRFSMAESAGELDSWNHFGQWYYHLGKGRDRLPESIQKEVKTIYESAPGRREGIKAVYEYMQNKTRYVSIQLGIGGWQPFEAGFVENKRYGDCKALTNYLQALLKYAGVESYPVLIHNGMNEPALVKEFPSNQFNHVVLYVPGDEPIWLESTSQSMPFNYIGASNSDRYGLLVKPDSSYLIKTPDYNYTVNTLDHSIQVNIDDQGNADIKMHSTYSGAYLDELLAHIAQKSEQDREKWLHETISVNTFSIDVADFTELDKKNIKPTVDVSLHAKNYATRTGDRLFIPLNKVNQWTYRFPAMKYSRTQPVKLPFSFEETDHITLQVAEGFEVEAIPKDVKLDNAFGGFQLTIKENGKGDLEISRNMKITRDYFEPKEYESLRSFFAQIVSYDSKNIVLRKK